MTTTRKTQTPSDTEGISQALSFASLLENAKTLGTATDDGFAPADRETLRDQIMVIQKFSVQNDNGRKWSRVWAIVSGDNGEPRKVKFEDGGRSMNSITSVLEEMLRIGVRGNVAVVLRGEEYMFEDRETGTPNVATRYTIEEYTA